MVCRRAPKNDGIRHWAIRGGIMQQPPFALESGAMRRSRSHGSSCASTASMASLSSVAQESGRLGRSPVLWRAAGGEHRLFRVFAGQVSPARHRVYGVRAAVAFEHRFRVETHAAARGAPFLCPPARAVSCAQPPAGGKNCPLPKPRRRPAPGRSKVTRRILSGRRPPSRAGSRL